MRPPKWRRCQCAEFDACLMAELGGGILLERVVEGRQVFNQRREILAGKAEHAGGGQGAHRRRAAPVAEHRDLAEVIAGSELSNYPLLTVGPVQHLDVE